MGNQISSRMDNRTILLIAAIVLIIAYFLFSNEQFSNKAYTAPSSSSVDCALFPDSPACQPPPPVDPVDTSLSTCVPPDGVWSTPMTGQQGRSTLNSPCCQPPNYELASISSKGTPMKTCDDKLDSSDPIQKCVQDCCNYAASEANNYDVSWYPMARCACSLWCFNQDVSHFKKYGTAVHYISGDIAEAETGDQPDFIGSGDFGGQ